MSGIDFSRNLTIDALRSNLFKLDPSVRMAPTGIAILIEQKTIPNNYKNLMRKNFWAWIGISLLVATIFGILILLKHIRTLRQQKPMLNQNRITSWKSYLGAFLQTITQRGGKNGKIYDRDPRTLAKESDVKEYIIRTLTNYKDSYDQFKEDKNLSLPLGKGDIENLLEKAKELPASTEKNTNWEEGPWLNFKNETAALQKKFF